ncbi:zinc finger protein pita-like isoform X2 [Armigeres subalbatus]|uniref:zinc finger protein pita-like isoform X2 n=1 Tax=Armigeres subalbatus TaxID=124917 RepID=UPI002ED5A5D0
MEDCSEEQLTEELKTKRICRFCLSQEEPLTDILSNTSEATSSKISKTSTPLTLQIMACVSIEVYKDDGMPCTICDNCRHLMDHSYRFKQICKKADTLLKTYPLTGVWPEKLQVPVNLFKSMPATTSKQPIRHLSVSEKAAHISGGIKSSSNVPMPMFESINIQPSTDDHLVQETNEAPLQIERMEEDVKPKIVKLSIEDLRNIKQGRSINSDNLIHKMPHGFKSEGNVSKQYSIANKPIEKRSPVKIINGSLGAASKTPVILNSMKPPNKMEEHIVQTSDGTLEIVCIESSLEQTTEVDPMKNAPHVETHVFPCTECERTFPLRQLLEIHIKNHSRERNHPCEMCDRRFFTKYDLSKHMLTHTGERPFICIICKAAFSRSTLLTRHQKIHKDQPKFLCMYCERTFLSNEDLQKHFEYHQKKRPFQCQKCSKSFAYKQGLERHEVTHETNLPFPCEHCELSFPSASKLARHLTAHAGSRPYPCRMCSSSFMLSHHLTRHVRAHQGGRGTYKCNECTSIFDNQDDLIYHSAEHATKSLTCPLCREHFESLEQVTEHIKEHSEGIQFACDYCDLLFTTEQKLNYHCQLEHLAVLAMDRTETNENVTDENDASQQFIIEEISIEKDGSKTITTFVDGEEKEKKYVQKRPSQTLKPEIASPDYTERTNKDLSEQAFEDDHSGEYYEEELDEDFEEQPETTLIKNEKQEILNNPTPVPVTKTEPSIISKPSEVSPPKPTQQKLNTFLKNIPPPITAQKSVGDVLKNLPKGMIVKRPNAAPPATSSTIMETKAEVSLPAATHVEVTQPSAASTSQSTTVPKKQSMQPQKQFQHAPLVTSTPSKPAEFRKPGVAIKRPADESRSLSPVKKPALESGKPVASAASSTTKPQTNTVSKPPVKKSKTFEMKIGDRMVKVQKVVMTKAEVAAMARDGKIEMQGDKMILKQSKPKK